MSLIQTYICLPQVTHVDTLTEPVVITIFLPQVTHIEPVVNITTQPLVFLHRQDASVNFTKPWDDYRNGFGSPDTNYWMGLDLLHTLTNYRAYGLRVDMTHWDGKTLWAEYDRFSVGPELVNYELSVGGYDRNSTAPDRMQYHNRMMFSTYDSDHDSLFDFNCARDMKGGWWYKDCFMVNPTGMYVSGAGCDVRGIMWWIKPGSCPSYTFKRMTFTLIPQ